MSELLQQFHFLRPWWLLALVFLPLVGWLGVRRNAAQVELSRLVDAALLPSLLSGRDGNSYVPTGLFGLALLLCVLALAGPTWSRVEQPLYASRAAQVVAISLSRHMLAHDVAPSRMARARYKARDLLGSNRDGVNALIGYAGEAFVVAPLTSDASSLNDLLAALAPDVMPRDGNDAALAIRRGVTLIEHGKAAGGSLVLITDQADAAAVAAARKAAAAGVRVSVLGIGTPQGAPVPRADGGFAHDAQGATTLAARDDASLRAMAAAGGGVYVPMSADQSDVKALHAQLRNGRASVAPGQQGDAWQDRGPWLLLPLLLIVALAFRRGWLLLLPLVLLPLLPSNAYATTWQDWWQRPDQQAAQALAQGHAKQAQHLARDPAWRGVAAYRAGDYAAAMRSLKQAGGADASYNLGNALARQGQYRQAIEAYEQALRLDPDNADAQANRKAVEDWLKQQKKQKQGESADQKKPKQQGKQGRQDQKDQPGQSASNDDAKPGKPGESGKASTPPPASDGTGDDARPAQKSSGDEPSKPADKSDAKAPAKPQAGDQPEPPTAQQQAERQAKTERAKQALKQQMDQALAGQQANKKPAHQLGVAAPADDPLAKLPAELQRALQRVPDDAGALLRRKFELEYRQRHGRAPEEDGQP